MVEETWLPVAGYEELYEVSNKGRIRSQKRLLKDGTMLDRDKTFYPHFHSSVMGYLSVWLYKGGIGKKYLVHRIVAKAFIPNTQNYPFINHKDETPYNNNVENLEWCTASYNNSYGTVRMRMSGKLINRKDKSIPILKIDKNGEITEYPSMQEASRKNGLPQSNIQKCCKGERHLCGGFFWKYKESTIAVQKEYFANKCKTISDEIRKHIFTYFSFNPATGEITRTDRKNSNGTLDKDGYLILKIKGMQYKAHRIAWLLYYGVYPLLEIDHINNNKLDNRINNLREVTRAENNYNNAHKINKDTGVVGVYYDDKTIGLKKRYVTRKDKKTYRFYTLKDAIEFRLSQNLMV